MLSSRSVIRKITIGSNPKDNGIAFQVGNRAGDDKYKICDIIEDTNNFFDFGTVKLLVYITDGKNIFLWKSFQNVPATIEYFLPTEKYISII